MERKAAALWGLSSVAVEALASLATSWWGLAPCPRMGDMALPSAYTRGHVPAPQNHQGSEEVSGTDNHSRPAQESQG